MRCCPVGKSGWATCWPGNTWNKLASARASWLADHFERAGEKSRAIRWLAVAAQQSLDADDLAETLARIERAVNLGAAGEELCAMRVIESQARYWLGEYAEAERAAREALSSSDARIRLGALSGLFNGLGPQAKYDEVATLSATWSGQQRLNC